MLLKIKEIRKLKNLSQDELAEKSTLSVRSIIDYEKPNADISLKKLQLIAVALEVSIFDLIYVDQSENSNSYQSPRALQEPSDNYLVETQRELITMQRDKIKQLEEQLSLQSVAAKNTG